MSRLDRETIYMLTAYLWSTRATCKQANRAIGCVITTDDMRRVLSISYNGPPKQLSNDACRNISGDCGCNHSEMNGIAMVDGTILNKKMFVTMQPCKVCAGIIAQANISTVYYDKPYRNCDGVNLLRDCGIKVIHMDLPCSMKLDFDKSNGIV